MPKKTFNPLDHPILFAAPKRISSSFWAGHIPFAMFLVELAQPKMIVELGALGGVSYCAFCQSVKELELDTRCYAVDNWEGDLHQGFYGIEILEDLRQHHDPLYSDFSTLIQSTFDEAVKDFEDGSIDLLHIDGYHTYDAVKHDFETWMPKLSKNAVVLFHDTNEKKDDFGVWKLWEELQDIYPSFEFLHSSGLGLIGVGDDYPTSLNLFFRAKKSEQEQLRRVFARFGEAASSFVYLAEVNTLRVSLTATQEQLSQTQVQLNQTHIQVNQAQEEVSYLSSQLDEIQNSTGYRLVLRARGIVERIFPRGSIQRRFYDFCMGFFRRG